VKGVIAIFVLVLTALATGQEPTFKGAIRTVAVYATVANAEGRLVPDLGRDAFSVLDNGKRQELTLFANDVQPITVVLLLDRSGSMRRNFGLVEKAAEEFVNALLPADKARIGSFSNRIQVDPRDFTSNHEELLGILRSELQEAGPTPLWNAIAVGMTALLHVEGRRVVLVFTDGMDNPMNGSAHNVTLRALSKRADEEDVMVYAIGLASAMDALHRNLGGGGYGGFGARRGGMRGYADHPDPGLQTLAAASGGGYFELTRTADLASTFARVADELHHQYLIGFVPQKNDGKSHKLEVQVKGEGLTVRARRSYVAAR
jgi:Ca-activated chloride channel family protein